MTPILLDTCAAIWLGEDHRMQEEALAALDENWQARVPVLFSPISAWEIGQLLARGRLALSLPPNRWIAQLVRRAELELAELSIDVLLDASSLPGAPPNDPADRILAASARDGGYRLMTRDRKLLDYAADGHLAVLPC